VGVYQEIDTIIDIGNPGEICNRAVIEGAWSQHKAVPTQYSTGVNETYSRRTDSRTFMGAENEARTTEGGAASGPKNDDDRCAQRPRGIQCYKWGLLGHTRSSCLRGQGKNLNGIGRTKATPPSCPK